ncbi:MAG: hypothetical protein JST92_18670, partial [Deltaproteobacteria bacterium]|nr:hypothetical protein [Deltaproteobacteria bacterium]
MGTPSFTERLVRLSLAFALASASLALPARADDSRYQDYPVGSRAMVLGGAFVALSDDPSGLTYNPAGLCDMRKMNVNVSASLYGLERTSRSDSTLLNGSTFSLATLAQLNVIPGEAGFVKGFGQVDSRGSRWALGFDVTVPSFRTYGLDQTDPYRVHTRIVDRTFDIAVGGAYRWDDRLNFGVSLHGVARLFDEQESALVADTSTPPNVASYTASTSFENVNLVLELGTKLRLDEGKWLLGASLGLPGVGVYSGGSISIQDITANPNATNTPRTSVSLYETNQVDNHTPVPLVLRAGAARIQPGQWTLSAQLSLHAGATYNRFDAPAEIASRLRIQDRVERSPVLDVNL